jgi:hypothetical protein
MKDKLLDEIRKNLNVLVGEEKSNEIISNMFFSESSEEDYVKGKVLTVGELKSLPKNSIIHLWYKDEDNHLRNNGFVTFCGYNGDDELCTTDGFTMPINGHTDDELIERFDNCGWKFTVSESLKVINS